MRVLRSLCVPALICGLCVGCLLCTGGCDLGPGEGSQVTITAAAKQQAQDRGEKMKALMAKKSAQQHRRR